MTALTPEEKELHFAAMDIKLFLRLASDHFPHTKDREVLQRLLDLADQYGHGVDIWKKK
jgi:hypothetical protein